MDWIFEPWPWYVSGPLIGLTVPALLWLSGESFGISSSFRHICSMSMPKSKLEYFKDHNWKEEIWNLVFIVGIVVGAAIGATLLSAEPIVLLPLHYHSLKGLFLLFVGGMFVGFGTRYAGGCTSGHSIMGMSSLNWVSLVATCSFFMGGLLSTWLLDLY